MSHTYINGFGGSIQFASATLDVASWSLNVSAEAADTTNTGDAGWETSILGAKAFEGSAETFFDSGAVPTGAAGFLAGARATVTLQIGPTGKSYTGSAQLTQVSVKNDVKGAVGFSINFKGSGALTYAT